VHIQQEEIYPTEIIGVMLDISERKEAEETIRRANEQLEQRVMERTAELRASLNEKEVLLKEIHHRVKNNLQVISSLLNLQKSKTKNPDVWNTLNDSQNRVRSMALIHEKLYETKDLARVDFGKYINDLAAALLGSYGVATDRVKLHIRSDVHLDIDTAIPCGLIVNELISNALKYAFPDAGNGEITIDFTKDQSNYSLTVQDNGVGFPKDRDFRTVDSLGMRLVNTLTRQLEGSIDMENASGTTFRIFFPEIRPAFHNGSSYNGARKME
ncbi:MAG TPA: sensor histidine kinase, partial [Acidobacteriota bacterium]|nr:sensor histidine kinase [Acidobacteriota bacterium]